MTLKLITAVAIAASVLAGTTVAEAGGKKHGSHKRHYGHHYGHNYGDYYGHNYGGGYFYAGGKSCKYIYRKARATGSFYWWNKFERCISRY